MDSAWSVAVSGQFALVGGQCMVSELMVVSEWLVVVSEWSVVVSEWSVVIVSEVISAWTKS